MKNLFPFLLMLLMMSACSDEIKVETAENYEQVELPDSSIVYLNQNSKLTYSEQFNPRTIKLEGEAFFSVNDGDTPFVIETANGETVTVIGTEFNLIANSKNVLLEVEIGSVSISIGDKLHKIIRGKRLFYGRHDNGLHLGQARREHRGWIGLMNSNFKSNGKILKRSRKHATNMGFKQLKGNKGLPGVKAKPNSIKPLKGNKAPSKSGGAKSKNNSKSTKGGGKSNKGKS